MHVPAIYTSPISLQTVGQCALTRHFNPESAVARVAHQTVAALIIQPRQKPLQALIRSLLSNVTEHQRYSLVAVQAE